MSPSYSASPSGSSSSHLRPDRVACMLSDDGNDFSQPPTRTYSLGSRPVKTGAKYSGYVDMSGRKSVSDNGRSCSAPHLITHPHHHRSGRNSNLDSPTPSASPLSMSLKSDDSDSFMELDFYRPRTASDSYSYRPRASSFGMPQSALAQGHRPRSSSHGQGTRPLRRHKMLGIVDSSGRLNHDLLHRSQNSSHGSFDSLKVSSSESLRKLSQEVRTKTSQLNSSDYMDMSFEKRHTPSPQPGSAASSRSGQNGYVDMTLGNRKSSPSSSKMGSRSNSKTSSSEKLQDSEYTNMSLGGGGGAAAADNMYMNFDSHEGGGKKDSPSRSSSSENVDTYIMYEPATTPTSTSGKGAIPKGGEPASADPRGRSGSGGKEQKKRSFFSLRHSHGDSSKHSSKKSETPQQPSGVISYSSTGGDKFGSLGRNIRQKSKDAEKCSGRKSGSFSRTFGTSATKPGKLLRKTPTPPKSLDGNDEYIEFSPMAVKSDSDSSHSSGSTRVSSRTRHEVVPAKQEAEYVGFEPGNIPACSSTCGQRGSTAATTTTTSGYISMSAGSGGVGGQGVVFKPVKKPGTKRSKSKEEPSQPSPSAQLPAASPHSVEEQRLAKPVPMYPASQRKSPTTTPTTTPATTPTFTPPITAPTTPSPSTAAPEPAQSGLGSEGGRAPHTAAASSASCSLLPSPDSVIPSSPSSSSSSSFVMVSKPAPVQSESGYMDFDPGKPTAPAVHSDPPSAPAASMATVPAMAQLTIGDDRVATTPATAPPLPAVSSPASRRPSSLTSVPGPVQSGSSEKNSSSGKTSARPDGEEPEPAACPPPVVSPAPSGRSGKGSGSGGTTPTRKTSGDKLASCGGGDGAKNGSQGSSPSGTTSDPSCDDKCVAGSGGIAETGRVRTKEVRSPRLSQGSQGSQGSPSPGSSSQQGLTRPDSTPCMLSLDRPASSGRGRGRHSSSSSVGAGQPKKGAVECSEHKCLGREILCNS